MRNFSRQNSYYNVLNISELFHIFAIEFKIINLNVTNKYILGKLIRKNRGNSKLINSVQLLIDEIERSNWKTPYELLENRPDADCVYGGEFYFFNINIHRTLIMIEFEASGEATIVWAGNHDDYELTFKNNRNVIRKWLKANSWI